MGEFTVEHDVQQAALAACSHDRHTLNRRRYLSVSRNHAQPTRPLRDQEMAARQKSDAPRILQTGCNRLGPDLLGVRGAAKRSSRYQKSSYSGTIPLGYRHIPSLKTGKNAVLTFQSGFCTVSRLCSASCRQTAAQNRLKPAKFICKHSIVTFDVGGYLN